ncbi:hypothetical protein [Sphingomonas adhaesiva]|uniref:hypothetical protein n=1 Tax=Sphingomonas adhaesiva TaxID=28212 RepID=UPI002FFCF8FA
MAATVDGQATGTDAYGIVQGDGGAVDKMSGTSGNDRLEGHAAFNQYYGGAGNDTFIISYKFAVESGAHQGASTAFGDQYAYITDFGGASTWSATGNDFVAFSGFGAGATLTLSHEGTSGTSGAKLYYYTITTAANEVFNVLINSVNGKALATGDYAFY